MSVQKDDARDEAATVLLKAITKTVEEVEDKTPNFRIPYLKDLADAYAAVTFGTRIS